MIFDYISNVKIKIVSKIQNKTQNLKKIKISKQISISKA